MLISLIVVNLSQCMCTSKHHIVRLKYSTIFVSQTSIKLGKRGRHLLGEGGSCFSWPWVAQWRKADVIISSHQGTRKPHSCHSKSQDDKLSLGGPQGEQPSPGPTCTLRTSLWKRNMLSPHLTLSVGSWKLRLEAKRCLRKQILPQATWSTEICYRTVTLLYINWPVVKLVSHGIQ